MRLQTLALSAAAFLLLAPAAASATDIQAVGQPCSPNGLTAGPNLSGQSVICTSGVWALAGGEWAVNGTNYYYSGGNVGIGTTAPTYNLDISVGGSFSGMRLSNTNANYNIFDLNAAGSGGAVQNMIRFLDSGTGEWSIGDNQANSDALTFSSASLLTSAPRMVITTGGNVGIGTTSPNGTLDVRGNYFYLGPTSTGSSSNQQLFQSDGSGGSLRITGRAAVFLNSGSGKLSVTSGACESGTMYCFETGLVGIGTTSPQATLDVNGYARLALQSSQPAACSSTNQGAIALNHLAQMCICNGTAWNFESSGSACSW